MSLWTLEEIYNALDIKTNISENYIFSGVSIDTRTLKEGDLFIPIKGPRFDGHNFIEKAFKKGALASFSELIDEKSKKEKLIISVSSTLKALEKLAKFSRKRNKKLIKICITGSSGKTTLKDWISKTFKEHKKIHNTEGNLNNKIGLPLTLANMPRNTELCVLEIGMNSPGEIKKLTEIARPNIAIITNIGVAHSANFLSDSGIASEKSDIFNYLNKSSIAIFPRETKYFDLIKQKALKKTKKIFIFGNEGICNIKVEKKMEFEWHFNVSGEQTVLVNNFPFTNWSKNVAIILCLSKILNISLTKITPLLKKLRPTKGRGKISNVKINTKNLTIIDESYNSNPESLNAAIQNLSYFRSSNSRVICIIGDMLELGDKSNSYHLEVVNTLLRIKPNLIITVGQFSKIIFDNLPENFLKFHYYDYKNVFNKLLRIIRNKDVIMLKGSNSVKLHMITKQLLDLG